MTLRQYSKGSHTTTSALPQGRPSQQISISLRLTGESSGYTLTRITSTCAQPQERPTQQISISLSLTGE
jgi:hypothetical protein